MSGVDDPQVAGLPDDMVEGIRDLALARVAGTTPWPRVRTAVRRDRRRRAVGASAAAAGLVAATVLTAGTLLPDTPAAPAGRDRQVATPTPTRSDPSPVPKAPTRVLGADSDPMDLTGATAGSLGQDESWLAGLKARVVDDEETAPDVAAVRVLWAADHAGQRHALTASLKDGTTPFLTLWRGNAGSRPDDMYVESRTYSQFRADKSFMPATLYQIRTRDRKDGPGLFVATGTDLMTVETATGNDYDAAGRRVVTWAPLQPHSAVFVRVASDAELDSMVVRGALTDGEWFQLYNRASFADEPRLPPGFPAVSPSGADPRMLACAAGAFAEGRGLPAGAAPVLGAMPRLGPDWVSLVVARAPAGGYLVGFCRKTGLGVKLPNDPRRAGGFVVPAPEGGARDLLVLVPCKRASGGAGVAAVCVVAPEGATEVEVGGVRAEVHDRVAVVEFPRPVPEDGLRATARREDGEVIGPVRRAETEEAVTDAALPVMSPPQSR
jgi:hypothetical protein